MSNMIAFIGRPYTLFSDNLKYAFLSYLEHGTEFDPCYLTANYDEYQLLEKAGLPVVHFEYEEDLASIRNNLAVVVSDSHDWRARPVLYENLADAPFVNLWHGLPLKKVGLNMMFDRPESSDFERACKQALMSTAAAAYVSTSNKLTDDIWKRSFHADEYPVLGYARNDVLLREPKINDLLNVDHGAIHYVGQMKDKGHKIVMCCPTFRGGLEYSLLSLGYDLERMNAFGEKHGVAFLLKLHPIFADIDVGVELSHLRIIDHKSDIYPLMSSTDALITDFSSIFFDYLLIDKPILFFANDLAEYRSNDRGLSYRFEDIACGPVCEVLDEVLLKMSDFKSLDNPEYELMRVKLRNYMFEIQDGYSGQRLVEYVDNRFGSAGQASTRQAYELPITFSPIEAAE